MLTSVDYPADGANDLFSVPFPYLSKAHVVVSVDGVVLPTTAYEWLTLSSIHTLTVYSAPSVIQIKRQTPAAPLTTYQSGSTLTQEELEVDSLQALYRIEELENVPPVGVTEEAVVDLIEQASLSGTDSFIRADLQDAVGGKGSALVNYLEQGTGAHQRDLASRIAEHNRVSVMSFIPEVEHAAIAAGTSTFDCTTYIQNAIAAVVSIGGGTVFFPRGAYTITSTIVIQDNNVYLEGIGTGHTRQTAALMRDSGASRLVWSAAVTPAAGTAMVEFRIASLAYARSGGGMRDMILYGSSKAPVGLRVMSWSAGNFDRVAALFCTEDHFLLETADYQLNAGTAGATQWNRFFNCYASDFSTAAVPTVNPARGFRLKGGSSWNDGDSSVNTFLHCQGYMSYGNTFVIENCGQDCFINCWAGSAFDMAPPVNAGIVPFASGGTLGAGTYSYRVAAFNNNTGHLSAASAAQTIVVASGSTNRNKVQWTPAPGATHYYIYGRTSGLEKLITVIPENNFSTDFWIDDGSITPSTTLPGSNRSYGTVLGSTEQATNTGAKGVARHHCFLFCEMRFWCRAGQTVGSGSSFGNMMYGISNGDVNVDPVILEAPVAGIPAPRATWTTSGATAFNTPALGKFDIVDVDSVEVGGAQVVGARDTGWAAMTGTGNKGTTYDTGTITLAQLAGRVKSIQAALTTHGLLGT